MVPEAGEVSEAASVAETVRAIREARGFSQGQVARWLGISPVAYGHYERGRTLFTVEQIMLLARHLRVPVSYLFGEQEEDPVEARILAAWRGSPPQLRPAALRALLAVLHDETETP